MKGLEGEKQNLKTNVTLNREPVKLLKSLSDRLCRGRSGNNTG